MRKGKAMPRPMVSFVILSYVIFLAIFSLIGNSMALDAPKILVYSFQVLAAWSSTFALIILFGKIYPELSFRDFLKQQFGSKLKLKVLAMIISIQVTIFSVAILLLQETNSIKNITLSFTAIGILSFGFIDHLIRGPLGEELGWRGLH